MAYSIVQQAEGSNTSASNPTATFAANITAGNTVVAAVTWGNGANQTWGTGGVKDGLGTAFTPITGAQVNDAGSGQSTALFLYQNHPGGTKTATFTLPGSFPFDGISLVEISGLATTGGINSTAAGQHQAAPGTGAGAVTSGNTGTLSGQPAILLGFCMDLDGGGSMTAASGTGLTGTWQTLDSGSPCALFEHQRLTATTAAASTFTAAVGGDDFGTVSITIAEAGGGGGVTENLTEQTATFTEGAPTLGLSSALTGQTATSSEGTVGANVSYALTGQSITSSEGTIARAVSTALTAQTATFTEGTITATTGVVVALSGQTITSSEGTLTRALSTALTGQSITSSEGTLTHAVASALTAQTITSSEGAPTPAATYGLTAQTSTFTEGTITVPGGNITKALSAVQAVFTLGTISASVPGAIVVPRLIGLPWIEASHVLITAGLTQTQDPVALKVHYAAPGVVIDQSPSAGSQVSAGTNILLTVVDRGYLLSASFDVIPWYI